MLNSKDISVLYAGRAIKWGTVSNKSTLGADLVDRIGRDLGEPEGRVQFFSTDLSALPVFKELIINKELTASIHVLYLESLRLSIIPRSSQDAIREALEFLEVSTDISIYGALEEHNSFNSLRERDEYNQSCLRAIRLEYTNSIAREKYSYV